MKKLIATVLGLAAFVNLAAAQTTSSAGSAPPDPGAGVRVTDLSVRGQLQEQILMVTMELTATTAPNIANQHLTLISGDVVLDEVRTPTSGYRIEYDPAHKAYVMQWASPGTYKVEVTFGVRAREVGDGTWREAAFSVPSANVRELEMESDRTDMEVDLPEALRVERHVADGKLVVRAVQGPNPGVLVRWKPQVQEMDTRLVFASQTNAIATFSTGELRLDALVNVDVVQGKLNEVMLAVPVGLNVTQVRGQFIQDWQVRAPGPPSTTAPATQPAVPMAAGASRNLVVTLNRPQTEHYTLQVLGEAPLPSFPAKFDLPVIVPLGGIRASGQLAVGTDSAIQLLVNQAAGLSQIEVGAFPRALLDPQHPRGLPVGKAFFYTYASSPYQLSLGLDEVVPTYDASQRMAVQVKEDDLAIEVEVELDIRDAPLRGVTLVVPAGYAVAGAGGPEVEDYAAHALSGAGVKQSISNNVPAVLAVPAVPAPPSMPGQEVAIRFKRPVLGRTLVGLRLELGRGPLDQLQRVTGVSVRGAKNERGYIVVAADSGLQVEAPKPQNLREVHTGSVPVRVADAQYAYRFRDSAWSLDLLAHKKAASIRVESFHLVSIGEGVAHGMVAVSYFISGSPVDELRVAVPDAYQNVEFVTRDLRRATRDPQHPGQWTVKLQRKIIGDYNLGITYTQRYQDGGQLLLGGIACQDVTTQTGYLVVASHMDLQLQPAGLAGRETPDPNLLDIDPQEVPPNYRLLVSAPILRTFKYVSAARGVAVQVRAYQRGSLPPVLIELVDLHTDLGVVDGQSAESATTVRYKIKNSTEQFLTLVPPPGATTWSARLIEAENGQERATRIAAVQDKATGQLLIPLPRKHNPNEPTTIEVIYGQVHHANAGGGGGAPIELTAPASPQHSTFCDWVVRAPQDWSVQPVEGSSMTAQARPVRHGDLGLVLQPVGAAWRWALERWTEPPMLAAMAGALGVLVVVLILHRRSLGGVFLFLLVVLALVTGVRAATAPGFLDYLATPDDLGTLRFTRTVALDQSRPLTVEARLVPAWRQAAGEDWAWMLPGIAAGGALLSLVLWRRRFLRAACLAISATALLLTGPKFPLTSLWLGHALTWGVPALVLVWFITAAWGAVRRRLGPLSQPPIVEAGPTGPSGGGGAPGPAGAAGAVAAILLAMFWLTGCTAGPKVATPLPNADQPVIDRLECRLVAEPDSMSISLHAHISASKPGRLILLREPVVLLNTPLETRGLAVETVGGRHEVRVKQPGTYDLDLHFLAPLPPAGADLARQFRLPLPLAVTNRVELTIPQTQLEVQAPTAVRLTKAETPVATMVHAMFAPGDDVGVTWKPRYRQPTMEQTQFFAQVDSIWRFDTGMGEGRHVIAFQVAQGELRQINIGVPENMTVTAVEGPQVGAWRFEPAKRELEVRLVSGVTGDYRLLVVTQIGGVQVPFKAVIAPLEVKQAARQLGRTGLLASPAVYLDVTEHPQPMNAGDFVRDAAVLMATLPAGAGGTDGVRQAYRTDGAGDRLTVAVTEVKPEIRTAENAVFSVADDRLVYNARFIIDIAKAGVFSVDLRLPEGYDVDSLSSAEVSHWDEKPAEGGRVVEVHFNRKLLGQTVLALALSRAVAELPPLVVAPRVEAVGAIKHSGQLVVNSDRSVRLSVTQRSGVSEINPLELDIHAPGALAFRLLDPHWELGVQPEVLEPRVNVDFLHTARVTEGMVRHVHYLQYRLQNAGVKVLEVQLPKGALGVVLTGPDIARREELPVGSGHWRLELGNKWYDRPYPLTVRYETQYDRTAGVVKLEPVKAIGPDLQRGYLVVEASERVALVAGVVGASLQPDDSRNVPREFGAGDLSNAAYCFRAASNDYNLTLTATRHDAVALLEAEVQQTLITTVLTTQGQSVNRVQMQLRVGNRHHLEARLPAGAQVWSLTVDGRSIVPTTRVVADQSVESVSGPAGAGASPGPAPGPGTIPGGVLLIPLDQTSSGESPVQVDLVYALTLPAGLITGGGRHSVPGPRFDLPLRDVQWTFYVPEDLRYSHFGGTLTPNEDLVRTAHAVNYDVQSYDQDVAQTNMSNSKRAIDLQARANALAANGQQRQARQAFESAWYYSMGDPALNEDTRVQLHELNRKQAMVGLIVPRGRLRQQEGQGPQEISGGAGGESPLGEQFNSDDADRLRNSLNKADSENLEGIIERMIEVQEAAEGSPVQLTVNMPARGRMLEFDRPLQVEPNAPMSVEFTAEAAPPPEQAGGYGWGAGAFVVLLAGLWLLPATVRAWERRGEAPVKPA